MLNLAANDPRRLALQRTVVRPTLLLDIDFPTASGGAKKWTCSASDITIGDETWERESSLQRVTVPEGQEQVSRDRYLLQFLDGDGSKRARFVDNGWTGIGLQAWLTFKHQGAFTEPLKVYDGKSSAPSARINQEGAVLNMVFTGQLTQINGTRQILLTEDNQKNRSATDNSMKYVADKRVVHWGRN